MCYNPIKVKIHSSFKNYRGVLVHPYNKTKTVNCGQCIQCREQYIESWCVRWREQLKTSQQGTSYMLTLTYNNENLPQLVTPDGEIKTTLNYPDVQKFIKRLRKKQHTICSKLGIENPQIKYHGAGEYGTNFTKRPHYHILITNLLISPDQIETIWGKGLVHIGNDTTETTINYILKYTLKNTHSSKKPVKLISKQTHVRNITPFSIMHGYVHSDNTSESFIQQYGKLPFNDLNFDIVTESGHKTLYKYHPKGTPNEYRVAEKTFLSKGIGKEYLTHEKVTYHRENPRSTYDYYDVKKRVVKQRPLPRYYHDIIYNPIKKDAAGKNMYDADKKPIRIYDKKHQEHYETSPLYKKQALNYQADQKKLNTLLKQYNNDLHQLTLSESLKRQSDKRIATERRNKILQFQKHTNKIKNIQNS